MKKSHLYLMLLFLCSIAACKKEEVNNPDIEDVTLDISLETTDPEGDYFELNIDDDDDGIIDLAIEIDFDTDDADYRIIRMYIRNDQYEMLANLINGNYIIKNITKDTEILESNTRWITNFEHLVMYEYDLDGGTIDEYGFTDIGDQYIAFRKKNSAGGYFYGWMLVNIENGEKITIKEYALHKIADTPIKAGEK